MRAGRLFGGAMEWIWYMEQCDGVKESRLQAFR